VHRARAAAAYQTRKHPGSQLRATSIVLAKALASSLLPFPSSTLLEILATLPALRRLAKIAYKCQLSLPLDLVVGTNDIVHLALEDVRNFLLFPQFAKDRISTPPCFQILRSLKLEMSEIYHPMQGRPTQLLNLHSFTIEGKDCRSGFAIIHP
jgi:hypothetical protein